MSTYNVEIVTVSDCHIIRNYDSLSFARKEYVKETKRNHKRVTLYKNGKVIDTW